MGHSMAIFSLLAFLVWSVLTRDGAGLSWTGLDWSY